jgi:hypothetical protein
LFVLCYKEVESERVQIVYFALRTMKDFFSTTVVYLVFLGQALGHSDKGEAEDVSQKAPVSWTLLFWASLFCEPKVNCFPHRIIPFLFLILFFESSGQVPQTNVARSEWMKGSAKQAAARLILRYIRSLFHVHFDRLIGLIEPLSDPFIFALQKRRKEKTRSWKRSSWRKTKR